VQEVLLRHTHIHRRQFLLGLGAAAALVSGGAIAATHEAPLLFQVYRQATRNGRALLVLVVPDQSEDFSERGQQLGAWLVDGHAEQVAPLAFVELACGTLAEIQELVPDAQLGEAPWAVLIETTGVPAEVHAIVPEPVDPHPSVLTDDELRQLAKDAGLLDELAEADRITLRERLPWQVAFEEEKRTAERHRDALAKAVFDAILPDPDASHRRVAQLEAAGDPTARFAALWAGSDRCHRDLYATALRTKLKERALDQRIPGSKWASASGCGTRVHDDPDGPMYMCGMGHVPALGGTFLYFFHRENP
jgi:hypothetical protein